MSLSSYELNVSIAVSDMARETEFYERQLGLSVAQAGADGTRIYATGGSAALHVYPSPGCAGESTATLATWYVDDVERVVDELGSNGVTFEHYEGVTTDEKGISPSPRRRREGRLVQGSRRQHVRSRGRPLARAITG